ncbi:MAG: hypothetical protein GX241_01835 [Ruminococcaceae bacterium]|nr:hypothetical protein [Oscillospiraceae bacterium]
MINFFEKTKGSVSIFLILVLFPMYTCAYLAIDSARYSAAKDKAYGALNLCGNTALSDYDRTLKELYGIFAISHDEETLSNNLLSYFSSMIDASEISFSNEERLKGLIGNTVTETIENTINTKTEDLYVIYNKEKSLANISILENQIEKSMKYKAPYNWVRGTMQKVSVFTQAKEMKNVFDKSSEYYKSVSKSSKDFEKTYEGIKEIDINSTNEDISKSLGSVLETLPSLYEGINESAKKSKEWKDSIEEIKEGEIKGILKSEYDNVVFETRREALSKFEAKVKADIERTNASEEQITAKDLSFIDDPFYSFLIRSFGNQNSDESENSTKTDLEKISNTKVEEYVPKENINIPALVEEEVLEYFNFTFENEEISLTKADWEIVSNCYVMEFISENFNSLTSPKRHALFLGEQEYIVFGKENSLTNLNLCCDLIFALRLVMNSAYVFTNAKMRQSALVVATSLAGVTGVGVPLAQNILLLTWATAESVLDVASLCKGETVPIYKNAATWTLGIENIPNVLAADVADYASRKIDDVFLEIEEVTDEKIESVKDVALNYINQAGESATETVTSMIIIPVENTIMNMLFGVRINYSKEDIANKLVQAIDSVENDSKAIIYAKKQFKKELLPELVDVIYENLEPAFSLDEKIAQAASEQITKAIENLYSSLFLKVSNELEKLEETAKDSLEKALDSTSEKVKDNAVKVINEYAKNLSSSISGTNSETGSGNISAFAGFGMTYNEYLKIFSLIALSRESTKKNVLRRCALVMQINCSNVTEEFNILNCYTSVTIGAKTKIGLHTIKCEETFSY